MKKAILSLCDYTGNAVRPWLDAGYDATIVDLQHEGTNYYPGAGGGELTVIGADILTWAPDRAYQFITTFPPCTHLAVSGARWFQGKGLGALAEAIELVARVADLCDLIGAPYMIENPVSTLATYWRPPDYRFDPCDYAGYLEDSTPEAYTKKTCLWVGNGFVMPEPKPVPPVLGSKMHRLPPGPERANIRSATPRGFAKAVFEANGKVLVSESV